MMSQLIAAGAATVIGGSMSESVFAGSLTSSSSTPVVSTRDGQVRGALVDGVNVFKGVPYGASPSGVNRFLPPRRPEPWSGVREALRFGPMAVQQQMVDITYRTVCRGAWPAALNETSKPLFGMSEDCLVLNVWSPYLGSGNKLPVMVWLHPGGCYGWAGNSDWTDGTNLSRKNDIVVVSLNHRVNIFGFLYLANVDNRYAESGCAGMLDIVQALKWVHENIEQFGGDRDNVTIFGESGGGAKVTTMMAMPDARGLFHRAIVQSDPMINGADTADAARVTEYVLKRLNITGRNPIEQLVNIDTKRLLEAGGMQFQPVVGSRSFPSNPFYPDAPLGLASVPMLAGNNKNEANFSFRIRDKPIYATSQTIEEDLLQYMCSVFPQIVKSDVRRLISTYASIYPSATPDEIARGIATAWWKDNIFNAVEAKLEHDDSPVFMYSFNWQSPGFNGRYGAAHTFDIPFVFDNIEKAAQLFGGEPDARGYELATNISRAWAAFARSGNPSHPGLPTWRPYTLQRRATIELDYSCALTVDPDRAVRVSFEPLVRAQLPERREFKP